MQRVKTEHSIFIVFCNSDGEQKPNPPSHDDALRRTEHTSSLQLNSDDERMPSEAICDLFSARFTPLSRHLTLTDVPYHHAGQIQELELIIHLDAISTV